MYVVAFRPLWACGLRVWALSVYQACRDSVSVHQGVQVCYHPEVDRMWGIERIYLMLLPKIIFHPLQDGCEVWGLLGSAYLA